MRRVLTASEPRQGRFDGGWRWCDASEVIVPIGPMCSHAEKRCACGCSVSFIGIESRKATTHGRVTEVDADEFAGLCYALRNSTLKAWDNDEEVADDDVEALRGLSDNLGSFTIGDVLCVERWPVDYQLIRQSN